MRPAIGHAVVHAVVAFCLMAPPSAASANDAVWNELRGGGLVVMIRHANAPGTGDPPGFRVDDCATQRNLSDQGRAQARALGSVFRERAIPVGRVLSSRWCRALDTARLAFGNAEIEPALDSLYGRRDQAEAQNASTRAIMQGWTSNNTNLIMVTHNANIAALTGLSPADAEAIVVRPRGNDRFEIVGRVRQ